MSSHDLNKTPQHGKGGHCGHGWMMIVCCIPMLAIGFAILASGAGVGFLIFAVMCTLMMVMMMMGAMSGGGDAR